MVLRLVRLTIITAVVLSAWAVVPQASSEAQAEGRQISSSDLFYNFYTPATISPGAAAQLYVSPRPVPPMAGHTYITYQPLMPHEFLYQHHRVYHTHHPDGRKTRTIVRWH